MRDTLSPPLATPFSRRVYEATVVGNDAICREHFRIRLAVHQFPPTIPGQFVQLQAGDDPSVREPTVWEWSPGEILRSSSAIEPSAMLNRPFSIAARHDDGDVSTLEIIYRVVGLATAWLQQRVIQSPLRLIGPLGSGFSLPQDRMAVLVGGGVGIPPMLYCAQTFGRPAIAFCGAMTRELLPLTLTGEPDRNAIEPRMVVEEFARHSVPAVVTSDDGSIGRRGYATDALTDWLEASTVPAKIYACGPEPMLKTVAHIAGRFAVPCEVAVERSMACGLGTCQSCVIRVRDGEHWRYRLACSDGPVFDATQLLW